MDILEFDMPFLSALHEKARNSERQRMHYDLRTTAEDSSQRIMNALEPGTVVPIHIHPNTSETFVCLQGKMDVVLYEVCPDNDGEQKCDGIAIIEGIETRMSECVRIHLCPAEGKFGAQVPPGVWHSVEVYEPSAIFEAKDGKYMG